MIFSQESGLIPLRIVSTSPTYVEVAPMEGTTFKVYFDGGSPPYSIVWRENIAIVRNVVNIMQKEDHLFISIGKSDYKSISVTITDNIGASVSVRFGLGLIY